MTNLLKAFIKSTSIVLLTCLISSLAMWTVITFEIVGILIVITIMILSLTLIIAKSEVENGNDD